LRLGTTSVVHLTKNGLLESDSRGEFRVQTPGVESPSYATDYCTLFTKKEAIMLLST